MGPRLAVPNEAQNRRQGLQAGRTPGPGGGSGGGAGENPTQQTPKTDNPCRTPGPMPGQLGCIFSPTEPPEVGPTRRPSDSLPQALRPPWKVPPSLLRQSLLCSLAGFSSQPFSLLCLANSSPAVFQGYRLRSEWSWHRPAPLEWSGFAESLAIPSVPLALPPPQTLGKAPTSITGCRYASLLGSRAAGWGPERGGGWFG